FPACLWPRLFPREQSRSFIFVAQLAILGAVRSADFKEMFLDRQVNKTVGPFTWICPFAITAVQRGTEKKIPTTLSDNPFHFTGQWRVEEDFSEKLSLQHERITKWLQG
ncbi:MAG: hypothetical protein ABJC04_09195, partial [Verrucomicrobiota bacterium]